MIAATKLPACCRDYVIEDDMDSAYAMHAMFDIENDEPRSGRLSPMTHAPRVCGLLFTRVKAPDNMCLPGNSLSTVGSGLSNI